MNDARHEFRLEPFGGFDREAAFDDERVYARRLARRHVLGLVALVALKAALTYVVYHFVGWWGVGVLFALLLIVVFIRGTHAFPSGDR